MTQPSRSRRQVFRRGSIAALVGSLAGVSGCSALDRVARDDREVPHYATWAPAPDRLFGDAESGFSSRWYPFRSRRFDELAAYLDRRGESFEDTTLYRDGHAHPVVDVEPAEAGTELRGGDRGFSVLEMDRSAAEIVEAFQTPASSTSFHEPFEAIGDHEGYRLLSGAGGDRVVGVEDGRLVEAFTSTTADPLGEKRAAVEAIIEAGAGDGRYTDADATLEELVARLGTGMVVSIRPPAQDTRAGTDTEGTSEPIASGVAYTGAERNNATQILTFAFGSAAAKFAETPDTDTSRSWAATSVTREGRYIRITGTHHPATR